MLLCVVNAQTMGRGKPKPRSKARTDGSTFESAWLGIRWIVFLFVLSLLPPIFMFIYSLVNDPATPTLIGNIIDLGRERILGTLSKKSKKKKRT